MIGIVKVLLVLTIAIIINSYIYSRDNRAFVVNKLAWIYPFLFLCAVTIPSIYLLIPILLLMPLIVSRTRSDLPAIWISIFLSLPNLSIQLNVGSAYLFDFGVYRLANAGFLIAALIKGGDRPPKINAMDLPLLLFMALEFMVDCRSTSLTEILRAIITDFLSLGAPYWALRRSVVETKDFRKLMVALCFGAGVQSIHAAFQVYEHWPTYELISQHFGLFNGRYSQTIKMRGGLMRGNGPFPESTSFSWFLAFILTLLLVNRDLFRSRTHWWVAIGIMSIGLVVTQSREGWIAAALAIILSDVYRRRTSKALAKTAFVSAAYAVLTVASSLSNRLSESLGRSGGAADTFNYRQLLFQRGIEEIKQYPLFGRAPNIVLSSLEDLRQGEGIIDFVNAYIYYGLVSGLFGVVVFSLMLLMIVWQSFRLRKRFLHNQEFLKIGLLSFTTGAFTLLTAFTSGFASQVAIFVFLATALCAAAAGLSTGKRRGKPIVVDVGDVNRIIPTGR